jgi:hypothetical protein
MKKTTTQTARILSLALLSACMLISAGARADVPATCGGAAAELSKTWTKSDSFGDENFGAGYVAEASVKGQRDGVEIAGKLSADAQVFGSQQNIVKVDASAKAAVVARSASENIDVFVMGRNIFHHSRSTGTGGGSGVNLNLVKSWDLTFFKADKRFWVGPIPVKVKATAAGSAAVSFDSTIGILAVNANLTPSARAFVTASAGVDAWVAEAGVDGRLTLLDAAAPTTGEVQLTTAPGVFWKVDSDLALTYLAGRLNVFAKALGKRYEKKIADWSGTTRNIAIIHEQDCIKFL